MSRVIYQYWDTKNPPEEVSLLLKTWKSETGFHYYIYNYDTARSFIKQNFEISTLTSFDSCLVPAMQADFFRYCVLFENSGIYVDADTKSLGKLQNLITLTSFRGILVNRRNKIANDFLYFTQKKDPLLERVIRICEQNINQKISQNVWQITGPGIMTKLFNLNQNKYLFKEFSIIPVIKIKQYISFQWKMDYKKNEKDWRHFFCN